MEIICGLQPRTTLQDVVEALQARPGEWIAVRDLPLEVRNQDGLLFLRLGTEAPQAAPAVAPPTPTVTPPTVPKPAPAPARRTARPRPRLTTSAMYEPTGRLKVRADHVAQAEALAAKNGGVLVLGHDSKKYRSLYLYMAQHPDAFTHIQQRRGSDHRNSPEFHARLKANSDKIVEQSRVKRVQQAEELAASHGGMLPPLQALRQIDEGLYRVVLNHPSWFSAVPQSQPLLRKVKAARVVTPEPSVPEPTASPVAELDPVVVPEPVIEPEPTAVPEPIIAPPEPVAEPIPVVEPRPRIPLPQPDPYQGGRVVPLRQASTAGKDPALMGFEIDQGLDRLSHMEPGETTTLDFGSDPTLWTSFEKEVYATAEIKKLGVRADRKGRDCSVQLVKIPGTK